MIGENLLNASHPNSDSVPALSPPPLFDVRLDSVMDEVEGLHMAPPPEPITKPEAAASPQAQPVAHAIKFGELVVFLRFATASQVATALEKQEHLRLGGRHKKLGKIMLKLAFVSTTQAKHALRLQREPDPIEGYKLLERRGHGGMGVVYRAIQLSLKREVAVKVLARRFASESRFLQRFAREAKLGAALNHPHIVSAIDVGSCNGFHYYAMEYVEGWSVAEMLREDGPFDEEEALAIVLQVAKALEAAGEQQIIHRDIKPENILVTTAGVAKLTDLGLSKQLSSDCSLTREGKTLGTPFYVSPELARGVTNVDARSDIYSLGATLYHMLAGEVPFTGDNPVTVMARHIADEPVPLKRRAPQVSTAVARLVRRMLEKSPDLRYQTATELMEDVVLIRKGGNPFSSQRRPAIEPTSGRLKTQRERRPLDDRPASRSSRWLQWLGISCAIAIGVGASIWLAVELNSPGPGGPSPADASATTRSTLSAEDQLHYLRLRMGTLENDVAKLLRQEQYAAAQRSVTELESFAVGTEFELPLQTMRYRVNQACAEALVSAMDTARAALQNGKPQLALDYLRDAPPVEGARLNGERTKLGHEIRQQLGNN